MKFLVLLCSVIATAIYLKYETHKIARTIAFKEGEDKKEATISFIILIVCCIAWTTFFYFFN